MQKKLSKHGKLLKPNNLVAVGFYLSLFFYFFSLIEKRGLVSGVRSNVFYLGIDYTMMAG